MGYRYTVDDVAELNSELDKLRAENEQQRADQQRTERELVNEILQLRKKVEMWKALAMPDAKSE